MCLFSGGIMGRALLIIAFIIYVVKGAPLSETALERDELIRDFLRSPEYQICIQNIFLPGSIPNEGSKSEGGNHNETNIFEQCVTDSLRQFLENRRRKGPVGPPQKRSASPADEESSGSGSGISGMSGISQNQFQQCMQNAISFPGLGGKNKRSAGEEGGSSSPWGMPNFSQNNFQQCMQNAMGGVPGASSIPGMGSGDKQKRSASPADEESSGSGSGIPGMPGISQNQFQQCMQNAISFPGLGGKNKRSAGEEGGSSSPWGMPNFSQNNFQQCMQNAMGGVPGASSIPGMGSGDKQKRSASPADEESSGSGSGIPGMPGISQNQFQQCMQNAISFPGLGGKNKRSAGEEGGSSSPWGMPNFSQNNFQQCMQNAMGGVPGASSIPGMGSGDKQKRSASPADEESSGSGSGIPGMPGISQNQFQQCMQNAVSFPGLGGKNKRSAGEEGSSSSPWGMPNFSQNNFQQCMQNAMGGVPGASSIPGIGSGDKQKRSASPADEESSGSGSGIPGMPGISQNQFQQCMQNAVSFPGLGGKNKRSAGEEGSSSSPWGMPNFSQNNFQQCMQNAMGGVPGASSIPGMGSGDKQKRSASPADEESSGSGSGIPGMSGISQNQFQQCMQNAVSFPGLGGKNKRSAGEEGSSSSPWGMPNFSQNNFQQCMQNAMGGVPGASSIPGMGSGDKQKRSASPADEESSGSGSGIPGMPGISQNQFQQCMQNAVSFPGLGGKNKRSAGEEGSSSSPWGMPNFSQNNFQQCMQNAMGGVPGASSIPGMGSGDKQKRSASPADEESSGSGSGIPGMSGISQNQFQQCMQNAISFPGLGGKNKRSAGEEGGSSSPWGTPNFSQNNFQQCMQNAMGGVPGASSIPGMGNGDKQKR